MGPYTFYTPSLLLLPTLPFPFPLETEEQAPGGSPRRHHRAPSIPRNAEELACHLLHGSLRMTPSRQQILSYSGIRLEERASALQQQRQEQEAKEKGGRGRLHSSSDSMLLKKKTCSGGPRQRVCSSEPAKTSGTEGGASGDSDDDSLESNSEESSEEEEEVLVKRNSQRIQRKKGGSSSSSSSGSSSSSSSSSDGKKAKEQPLPEAVDRKSKAAAAAVKQETMAGRRKPSERGVAGRKGKPETRVESVRKTRNIKQKSLRRAEEEEEEGGSSVFSPPARPPLTKSTRKANSRSAKSRRRLRSMDTISSESEEEEEEEEDAHSVNGVDVSVDDLASAAASISFPPRRGRPHRLSRKSRSKSSSSVCESAQDASKKSVARGRGTVAVGRTGGGSRRSSFFSDSEVKSYETTPGVPSASSNEDLTVQKAGGGGRGWGRGRKSMSSVEDSGGEKKPREDYESSDTGGGGEGGRSLSNGATMNGEQDIKPMELVWAKCRGYPPYPALVSILVCAYVCGVLYSKLRHHVNLGW